LLKIENQLKSHKKRAAYKKTALIREFFCLIAYQAGLGLTIGDAWNSLVG